jgi:acyl carrier protein
MKEKINKFLNEILVSKGGQEKENLNPNLNLRNDLGLDSFDLAELTVKVEDEFGVDIFSNGIVHTLEEIYSILENEK